MSPTLLTQEQIQALSPNQYTEFVSKSTVRYTAEFKQLFLDSMEQGKSARKIFSDAGYDPDILGESRMKSFAHRVRKEAASDTGLHSGYKEMKLHPDLADYSSMPADEAMSRMQNEILYLHQELEFIKKIIELGRQGGQKQ